MRRFVSWILAGAFGFASSNCTPPSVVGPPLESVPADKAFGGAQCTGLRPQTEPDLMAWEPASRGALAAVRRQGIAVVRYEATGCDVHLELLSSCVANGSYQFVPYWESDSKLVKNATDLYAKLPVGAAGLTGKLGGNRALRTDYMLAGMAQIPIGTMYQATDLRGECSRATHVVTRLYLGGFAMAAGESRVLEATASVFVQAGAKSDASVEHIQHAGDPKSCESSRVSQAENAGCAVPLRLTLQPLTQAQACMGRTECESACTAGDAQSCVSLGILYVDAPPATRDFARAALLFRQACDKGDAGGCGNLGVMYLDGVGMAPDVQHARPLLAQACDSGIPWGCGRLGTIYERGLSVPVDVPHAATLFGKACHGGDTEACTHETVLLKHLCDGDDEEACTVLARMYEDGTGVAKDPARALEILQQSCRAGAATNCVEAGGVYLKGVGVAKDTARAVAIYKQVCDGGDAIGCTALGLVYFNGNGVHQDLAHAASLFQRACDRGDTDGCVGLGSIYEDGRGVRENPARALSLYKEACDGGSALGCASLGSLYEAGKGVPLDVSRAATLYQNACDHGVDDACRALERLQPSR